MIHWREKIVGLEGAMKHERILTPEDIYAAAEYAIDTIAN